MLPAERPIWDSHPREEDTAVTKTMRWLIPAALAVVLALALLPPGQAQPKDVAMTYIEGQAVTTIDSAKHTDESAYHAVINMYDALLYPKVGEGSMEPGPHVAESWKITDGAKVYTFQIRKGIRFQDG